MIAKLLGKGQDPIIQSSNRHVTEFAEEGLRTLFIAKKELEDQEYAQWKAESDEAKLALSDREERVAAVDEKIETQLQLIGSTAIEDRLQDKVADSIQFAKNAGIKVWVLTGDKIETAIMIGLSAGLLDNETKMDQHKTEAIDFN